MAGTSPIISLVTPVYNEAANLEEVLERGRKSLDSLGVAWEWIFVDDHSTDGSLELLRRVTRQDKRLRFLRLSRNSGSHTACFVGLRATHGRCAAILAADLQDPPELLSRMYQAWVNGNQLVWLTRTARRPDLFLMVWYRLIQRGLLGLKHVNPRGADYYLLDRRAVDSLPGELAGSSIVVYLKSIGFRQVEIPYDKQPRKRGKSGWTMRRKIALVTDTVLFHSRVPLRTAGALFVVTGLVSFAVSTYAALSLSQVNLAAFVPALLSAALTAGALFSAVLAEYVWKLFEVTRNVPASIIEETSADAENQA